LTLGDLSVTPLPVDAQTARVDLSFSLAERASRMVSMTSFFGLGAGFTVRGLRSLVEAAASSGRA